MTLTAVSEEASRVTGSLFNVQRCSLHDGPGIRTTAFFKGCPLACTWCHNPEGIDAAPVLMISGDRCLGCRVCVEACPVEEGGAAPAGEAWNRDLCTRCGACVEACPANARELAGSEFEVGELVDILERDRAFYDASGGGVTFSGGEPLGQIEFLIGCLRECRRRGLRTAVDTCGLAPLEHLLQAAERADLVLYDLKHMDPTRHRAETGADNGLILDNLRALSAASVDIWVRIPLIPGFNADPGNIEETGTFLGELSRRHRVYVLPYHELAESKRARMGESGDSSNVCCPNQEMLGAVAERLARHDLEVIVGGSA